MMWDPFTITKPPGFNALTILSGFAHYLMPSGRRSPEPAASSRSYLEEAGCGILANAESPGHRSPKLVYWLAWAVTVSHSDFSARGCWPRLEDGC